MCVANRFDRLILWCEVDKLYGKYINFRQQKSNINKTVKVI